MKNHTSKYLSFTFLFFLLVTFGNISHAAVLVDQAGAVRYYNAAYGYSFVSSGFAIDESDETIKTVFKNGDTIVDIFYDDLTGTTDNSAGYIYYSNKGFATNRHIVVDYDQFVNYNTCQARIIKWQRPPLKHLKDNYLYHAIIDIAKNEKEVYSIQISSKKPIEPTEYLNRFTLFDKQPNQILKQANFARVANTKWSAETAEFYQLLFEQSKATQLGIFEPTTIGGLAPLQKFEKGKQLRFDYILEYYSLSSYFDDQHFKQLYDDGRILELTFQTSRGNSFSEDAIYDILNGRYDSKLKDLARAIAKIKGPVLFRLNNEMNGDWCSYNALHCERDSRLFIAAWHHIYQLLIEQGGDNIIFVFNPNEKSFPNYRWNHYTNYFPGAQYVDVIGATGYNTGNYYSGESWRQFTDIYDAFMPDYRRRFVGYQFFITEFGSSIYGGDRIAWLQNMFQNLNNYGFKLAIYWNGIDFDANFKPARIYRLSDDPLAIEQFKLYYDKR